MCTGSAKYIWRRALHPPQLRRLFAPGSHLTGEQLLALVLALFIRHRLTAGHPDLTATGALDFSTAGGASGTNPPEPRNTPARRPGFCRYEAIVSRLVLYVRYPDSRTLASESNPAIERLYGLRRSALVEVELLSAPPCEVS